MSKFKKIAAALVLGAGIAVAGLSGGAGQAEAAGLQSMKNLNVATTAAADVHEVGGRRFRKFRRFHRFHRFNGDFGGCHYYKKKWKWTGSFFWKKKYFICRGWW